ncbi:MAG TPA: ribosome maturation factor RimP [Kiloniellales bacterium]|nr:ribosome maturation factor RimP [Kiloniellales bacterium]
MTDAAFGHEVSGPTRTSEGKAAEIEAMIRPTLSELGFAIVRVLLSGDRRAKLQVMIERADEAPLTVDDCSTASRAIETILDVEDPISGGYVLEVSSPGIDRPLTRPADFERWKGFQAKLELVRPVDGRRRFTGRLEGLEAGRVRLVTEEATLLVDQEDLAKAKLVLTDDLVQHYLKRPTASAPEAEAERPRRN